MEYKICPILSTGTEEIKCKGEKCEWYQKHDKEFAKSDGCSIPIIAKILFTRQINQ